MAEDTKARQDHDVHFRVTEEPEQVLEQDRVPAAIWTEEGRAEVTVRQQHGDRAPKDRQRQHQKEGGYQHRPRK